MIPAHGEVGDESMRMSGSCGTMQRGRPSIRTKTRMMDDEAKKRRNTVGKGMDGAHTDCGLVVHAKLGGNIH